MSKLITFLVAAAGASTVSVGGVYMLKKGNDKGDSKQQNKPLESESLSDFKTKKGGECAKHTFGENGIEFGSTTPGTQISSGQPSQSDANAYLGTASTSNPPKGCLIINWKKDEYTVTNNTKWKGTFTWTWSFVNDTKGFLMFGVAKTKDNEQKLEATGGFYLLEKDTGKENYEVKYHKEVTTAHEIDDIVETKFPKANANVDAFKDVQEYWGFTTSTDKLTKVCGKDECTGRSTSSLDRQWIWNWEENKTDGKSVDEWCEKLDWFSSIYSPTSFQLKDKLTSFKGTWTKKKS